MEAVFLYLYFALHSVLAAENGANLQKKLDPKSELPTISPEILAQNNFSEKFYTAQLSKLQSSIELYKQKILHRENERRKLDSKLQKSMSPECKKISCPMEEKPVCAKFFYKNKKTKPFYVSMINECEMSYMKCHRGLESTVVPMENCHSGVENIQASVEIDKKRSKRSVEAAAQALTTYKEETTNRNRKGTQKPIKSKLKPKQQLKRTSNVKPLISKKQSNLKSKTNVKVVHLNNKQKLKLSKKNNETSTNKLATLIQETSTFAGNTTKKGNEETIVLKPKNETNVSNKTILMTDNKINVVSSDNITFTYNKTQSEKNITSNDKTNLTLITTKKVNASHNTNIKSKTITKITFKPKIKPHKLTSRISNKTKSKHEVRPIRSKGKPATKVRAKTSLKSNIKSKLGQKSNIPKNLSKYIKKRKAGKRILRQGQSNGKQFLVKNVGKDRMFTHDVFLKDQKKQLAKPNTQDSADDTFNSILTPDTHIEGDVDIELDEKNLKDLDIETSSEGAENAEFNNHDVIKEANNDDNEELNDDYGPNQDLYKHVVKYDDLQHPLIVEPKTVGESAVFNDDEEYHYVPQVIPPIIKLETDDKIDTEDHNVSNGEDTPLPVPSYTASPNTNDEDNGDFGAPDVISDVSREKTIDAPHDSNDRLPMPIDKYNGADDKVDLEQYNAECPRQCPARDMMVCAMCVHGIYRTFLSVCHMRMYQCYNPYEGLELVSRFPCVMSAPLVTDNPQMQPQGRLSEPNDQDRVLLFVRCREKGMLNKNPRCTFDDNKHLNQEHNEAFLAGPFEYY